MDLQTSVKSLQNRFKRRLMDGQFDIEDVSAFDVWVSIEGYRFAIWISNGAKSLDLSQINLEKCFMHLEFSPTERNTIYTRIIEKLQAGQEPISIEHLKKLRKDVEKTISKWEGIMT